MMALALALVTAAVAIPVGKEPTGMTYGAGSLWTANYGAGSVTRVDPVNDTVQATIQVGSAPAAIAFGDGSVWVGDFGAFAVYRIDPATNTVIATIHLSSNVGGIAIAPGGIVWVSEYDGGAVDRIDPQANTVVGRTKVGGDAEAIAFDAGKAWVTNQLGYVTPIDRATGAAGKTIPIAHDVDAITTTPQGLWAATYDGGVLAKINPRTARVVRRVTFPAEAGGIAFFGRGELLLSDFGNARVDRLDVRTGRILGHVTVGDEPRDLAKAPTGAWVVEQGSSDVREVVFPTAS